MADDPLQTRRRLIGPQVSEDGTSFEVWAPACSHVGVAIEGGPEIELARSQDGYFRGASKGLGAGARYRVRLDGGESYPDPASRFQPDGPHGPSEICDPTSFRWSDDAWPGVGIEGQVLYEMHVGSFTPEGTWAAAAERLDVLEDLGITVIEMMPVAEFPGQFGWGYDGVNLFAPTRLYGRPDDLRRFIDAAHARGMGVILDVVYNHLGPDGNYLASFAKDYFSTRHETEWGAAINFDDAGSAEVRRFFIDNAVYWIEAFHFDGLRLDATQSIFDDSPTHILREIADAARAAAAPRSIILIGENEPQDTRLVRPRTAGGYGLDALWNDDLHHSAMVALTGRAEAYYQDYAGAPQEFIAAAKYGYLFQGQFYAHQGRCRGTASLDLPPASFVTFIQNHDQVANSDSGIRFHRLCNPAQARAMTALILLMPGTPMLFQGQEFWASTPFLYFADHGAELAELVRQGRIDFMSQFPSIEDDADLRAGLADPNALDTFLRCKLDWSEVECHAPIVSFHRDLLTMRRTDPTFRRQAPKALDGTVLGPETFALRYFGPDDDDRLVLVNLGRDFQCRSIPDPLVAPPRRRRWTVAWSSENAAYGGHGTPEIEGDGGWHIPAHATVVLEASEI